MYHPGRNYYAGEKPESRLAGRLHDLARTLCDLVQFAWHVDHGEYEHAATRSLNLGEGFSYEIPERWST